MKKIKLNWNRFQTNFIINLSRIRLSTIIAGRGSGKSALIAWLMLYILKKMPRSTWAIQGATFQQLLTRTLPGTFEFLDMMGFRRDVDYWINKKPNVKAEYLPRYSPPVWDKFITLKASDGYCVGFVLLSQDSSSRGPSVDGIIADESLELDHTKFSREAAYTNRGHDEYYKHEKMHHGIFHFSSMPAGNSWLFKAGDYYGDAIDELLVNQNALIELQLEWLGLTERKLQLDLWEQILEKQRQAKWTAGKGRYYAEYNVFDNLENVSLRYIRDMYTETPRGLFMVEALNQRSNKIVGGFYASLDRRIHTYNDSFNNSHLENLDFDFIKAKKLDSRQDRDCNPDKALLLGTDYGNKVNWIIVGQRDNPNRIVRILNEIYVKTPKILDHAVLEYCEYYRFHKNKTVHFYPDAEAFHARANKPESYYETTIKILRDHGWTVITGHRFKYNKHHNDTYHLVNLMFAELQETMFRILINSTHCPALLISMEQAPALDIKGKIKKDKTSERKKNTNRVEATDASDAFDQIIYYSFRDMVGRSSLRISNIFLK